MRSLVDDTIGGFNSFIDEQRNQPGDARITTVLFDDKYEVLHNNVNIHEIQPLSRQDYFARGMTALLDAVGKAINTVGSELSNMNEADRPGKVIFVITTDGQENSSKEFTAAQVKEMIEHQQNVYNWTFLFLGANIDSFTEAGQIGINSAYVANYTASDIGTQSVYSSVSRAVTSARASTDGAISMDWANTVV